jgi:hypothetical protein
MYHFHVFHIFTGAFGWLIAALCLIPYFLPTVIALMRNHPSAGGIFAVNFLFGWTVLGWIICLIWAASDTSRTNYRSQPPYNPVADSQDRIIAQLRQLQQLREEGALTEEEFNRQKAAILR